MHFRLSDIPQNEFTLLYYAYEEEPYNHFYMAIPNTEKSTSVSATDYHLIREIANQAKTTPKVRAQLEEIMLKWPTMCKQNLGRTNVIRHQIITTDQHPVRKRCVSV